MDILSAKNSLKIKGKIYNFHQAVVMGIINLTPDSFYDGGYYQSIDDVLTKVDSMAKNGAEMIDIGGCSTRPGSEIIDEKLEILRLEEPLKQLRNAFPSLIISVDTFRSKVAEMAIKNGADIINDITAGNFDSKLPCIVSENQVPYIIMHSSSMPKDMQQHTNYEDVTLHLLQFFEEKINQFNRIGINDLIIDPGFGFGKTIDQNYELLNKLNLFDIFGLPILTGISRKSMIYKALGITPNEALNGSSVLHTLALLNGATILRVHDVKEATETIKLVHLYQKNSGSNDNKK